MDPLADALACACIPGFAQRRYARLCGHLSREIGRPVEFLHAENLAEALAVANGRMDLIIGPRALVEYDAAETATPLRPVMMLTDPEGKTATTGLFVVRPDDPARTIGDLKGRTVLIGPPEHQERHHAALAKLRAVGANTKVVDTDNAAALAVIESDADAAVLSDYRLRLLIGCNVLDKGDLRVIGRTRERPFVTAFVAGNTSAEAEARFAKALAAMANDADLLAAMESRDGFVQIPKRWKQGGDRHVHMAPRGWTDWRGPGREGSTPHVPTTLPSKGKLRFVWRRKLTGVGLSGLTATPGYLIVADKRFVAGTDPDDAQEEDVWRCFDARTGRQRWELAHRASGEMDYSNSPRAAPVIHQGLAYLLGASGDLHCVKLNSGKVVWSANIVDDFDAKLPLWGMCATPLVYGDVLIVNPGGKQASLVALNRFDGSVVWKSPGRAAAYASFYLSVFGGVEQIVGYDAISLGAWDPKTGRRLWEIIPPEEGDFNVPTPVRSGGRLLVTTENNGTRLYDFDLGGRIKPAPVASSDTLHPDTSTPVLVNGLLFGVSNGLHCLDPANGLKTLWSVEDESYDDYAALIGGNQRVLIVTVEGELILIRANAKRCEVIGRLKPFERELTPKMLKGLSKEEAETKLREINEGVEIWSHPAIVGDRLFLRTQNEIVCIQL